MRDLIKVVFLENYNVSLAELMIPAADVSTDFQPHLRASGTNMEIHDERCCNHRHFRRCSVEILESVGHDNIYIFGMTSDDVYKTNFNRSYNSYQLYESKQDIKLILDELTNGFSIM